MLNQSIKNDYNQTASTRLHELRIVRGLVFYFPIERQTYYEAEFRWLYRSWIEMQNYEPALWRTDLILNLDVQSLVKNSNSKKFFDQLNCNTTNLRTSKQDPPMCTILDYIPIKRRQINNFNESFFKSIEPMSLYNHLLNEVNVFDDNDHNLWTFYSKLKDIINHDYIDSWVVAFDGYEYFRNKFDFLLKTDMDIFLTPLFGKWLPLKCNDFIVGRGGYSGNFNMKRLQKAAKNINLESGDIRNLGSTWYSTPSQFRIASYLTLVAIVYLSNEEFSETERQGKLGVQHWPDWHYGVVSLYGQNLAMNHLISSGRINITKLENLLDYPTTNEELVHQKVHLHVFHSASVFSKFAFKGGKYNNITLPINNTHLIQYYCLNIALDSKKKSLEELGKMSEQLAKQKY
jgi:hypothetical protein